jgi:DNA (cytosine-5)-methyltransferase 1
MTFRYVSLFSGIGGFEQALNKLGGTCVMASEIDKYANQAYEILYGHSTVGDVTKVVAEDVPNHDLLVGGFPCPTFSIAGGRDGMEYQCKECGHEHLITYNDYKNGARCPKCSGETEPKDIRGLLFFEIARIADARQPKALLLENVKGLVSSSDGEVLRVIVETLNQIGYTVDFEVEDSKYFGVPQHRERIFICAIRSDIVNSSEWNVGKRSNVVAKGKRKIAQLDVKTFNFEWPEQNEVTVRLRDILESDVDEKFYLSEEKTAKLVAQLEKTYPKRGVALSEPQMLGHIDIKGHDAIKRVYGVDGVSPTLTTMGGGHREPKIAEEQKPLGEINIVGYCKEGGYKANEAVYGGDGVMSTLCARDYKDPKRVLLDDGPKYRIRKLTPRECFRLQGFPDSEFDKLTANGISNSQLYKMAGNAVTVNVIDAIGKRLITYLND